MISEALVIFLVFVVLLALRWRSIKAHIAQNFSVHLRKPGGGFWGFMCRLALTRNNPVVEVTYNKLKMEPHHNVLELGFGYGHGLSCALNNGLRKGSGILYGVDYSKTVCDQVSKAFAKDIDRGNLVIYNEDVMTLPLEDDYFDRVCHTNCYYFWSDHLAVCKEILRVMKPGGLMVTGIQYGRVKSAASNDMVPKAGSDLDMYVKCLVKAGFQNVRKEIVSGQAEIQVIFAEKGRG